MKKNTQPDPIAEHTFEVWFEELGGDEEWQAENYDMARQAYLKGWKERGMFNEDD